jgi:hypothetical protein
MGERHRSIDSIDRPLTETEEVAAVWRAWQLAEVESGLALERWSAATMGGKAQAYDKYRHALEHEARAANVLASLLRGSSHIALDETLAAA